MLPKYQRMLDAWTETIKGSAEGLRKRIDDKARNARSLAAERERKKTPQQRDPKRGAWTGIVCVRLKDSSIEQVVGFFELMHTIAAGFQREGYLVEGDGYLEGQGDDRVFVAGVRFIRLEKILN